MDLNDADESMVESNSTSNNDEAVMTVPDFNGFGNDEMDSVEAIDPVQGLPVETDFTQPSQDTDIDINVTMNESQGEGWPDDVREGTSLEGSLAVVQRQELSLGCDPTVVQRLNEELLQDQNALFELRHQYETLQASYQRLSQESEHAVTSLLEVLGKERNQHAALQDDYQLLETSFQNLAERTQERTQEQQQLFQSQIDTYQRELVVLRELTKPTHYLRDLSDQPKRQYSFPPGAQLAALYESDCLRLNVFIDNLTVDELGPAMLGDDAVIASYVPQLLAAVWRRAEERVQSFLTERARTLEVEFGAANLASHFNDDDWLTRPPIDGAMNVALRFFVTYLQSRGVDQLIQAVAQEVGITPSPSEDLTAFKNDVDAWVVAKVLRSPEALWLHNIIKTLCEKGGDEGCLSTMEAPESVLSMYVTFVRWLILCRCSDPLVKLSPAIGTEVSSVESLVDVHELVAAKSITLINHVKFKDKDLRATPAKAFVVLPPMVFTMRCQTKVHGLANDDATAANEVRPCYSYVVEGEAAIDELDRFVASYVPSQLARRAALIRGESAVPAAEAGQTVAATELVVAMDKDLDHAAPAVVTTESELGDFNEDAAAVNADMATEYTAHAAAVSNQDTTVPAVAKGSAAIDAHQPQPPTHFVGEKLAESLALLRKEDEAADRPPSTLVVQSPDEENMTTAAVAKGQAKHRSGTSHKPVNDHSHSHSHTAQSTSSHHDDHSERHRRPHESNDAREPHEPHGDYPGGHRVYADHGHVNHSGESVNSRTVSQYPQATAVPSHQSSRSRSQTNRSDDDL